MIILYSLQHNCCLLLVHIKLIKVKSDFYIGIADVHTKDFKHN